MTQIRAEICGRRKHADIEAMILAPVFVPSRFGALADDVAPSTEAIPRMGRGGKTMAPAAHPGIGSPAFQGTRPRGGGINQMNAARSRRSLIAVVIGCVLAASMLVAGPASAASRGFKLHNKSNLELKLIEAKAVPTYVCNSTVHCVPSHYPIDFEGRPGDGSVLKPNGTDTWELKYKFSLFGGVGYAANLWYKIVGTEDMVTYQIETYNTSNESSCKVIGTKQYTCVAGGTDLEFKN